MLLQVLVGHVHMLHSLVTHLDDVGQNVVAILQIFNVVDVLVADVVVVAVRIQRELSVAARLLHRHEFLDFVLHLEVLDPCLLHLALQLRKSLLVLSLVVLGHAQHVHLELVLVEALLRRLYHLLCACGQPMLLQVVRCVVESLPGLLNLLKGLLERRLELLQRLALQVS